MYTARVYSITPRNLNGLTCLFGIDSTLKVHSLTTYRKSRRHPDGDSKRRVYPQVRHR